MRYAFYDKKNRFKYFFDSSTGGYVRTGILDENGRDTGIDPFMASFPHLIDVGIMGHCIHGKTGLCAKAGIQCYQSGLTVEEPNMELEDFELIVQQCKGKVNQFALGGRGDPDQHEEFGAILKMCVENRIVPNFTTSGYGLTKETAELCKKYCGAVAVSWYRSSYTLDAIKMLLDAEVTTNIHYVLGNNTIDEATERMKNDDFPKRINAVVYLLHKPVGQGKLSNVLNCEDPRVIKFFKEIDNGKHPYRIGMDSCCVPGLVNFCNHIVPEAIDTCEGGRFSCYISPDMHLLPCSFDQMHRFAVSLREKSIKEAWNSEQFEMFRSSLKNHCPDCGVRDDCMGGCPLMPEIVLCQRKEKRNEEIN